MRTFVGATIAAADRERLARLIQGQSLHSWLRGVISDALEDMHEPPLLPLDWREPNAKENRCEHSS